MPVAASAVLAPDHDAALVRMEGQLLSVLTNPNVADVRAQGRRNGVRRRPRRQRRRRDLDRIRPGSLVAVTGVYSYQGGPAPSFRLLLRSAGDVLLLVGGAVVDAWAIRR